MKPSNYETLKKENPDTLLLFRIGDFWELYDVDANLAAPILGLSTTNNWAGFPVQYANIYIQKLIKAGFRVATLEQST